jgi:hypothetical protein
MTKIRIICSECGGANVRRDAWAEWNEQHQRWELGTVFDQGFCEDCGVEVTLDEQPLPREGVTTSTTGDLHEGCGGTWEPDPACTLADVCSKCGEGRA